MGFDFDRVIDRRGTDAIKLDNAGRKVPADALPMWVADMDLAAPDCVLEALEARCRHGIFGYSDSDDAYWTALEGWMRDRFGWQVQREWLVETPGIVFAVAMAVRALTREGDAVLIQQPVYYPFKEVVDDNGRKLVVNKLVYENGRYHIDFEDFERKIADNSVKLFILCSPHNPVGRVWREDELVRMGEICMRHDVIVVSDEIHMDFVYPGHRHRVFADLQEAFRERCVVCTAPSKTFNLAGLQVSNCFVADRELRRLLRREIARTGYSQLNSLGIVACRAAYQHGGPWLEALLDYLKGSVDYIRDYLAAHIPQIKLVEPEGTYLVWLDCTALGVRGDALNRFMLDEAKLWLDAGNMFGAGGDPFVRINIATPRSTVEQAMRQLGKAVKNLMK